MGAPVTDLLVIHSLAFELGGKRDLRVVATVDGEACGTISVASLGKCASTIYQLWVAPKWRGRGVGRELVRVACRAAASEGALAVSAVVELGGPLAWWLASGWAVAHIEGEGDSERVLVSKAVCVDKD